MVKDDTDGYLNFVAAGTTDGHSLSRVYRKCLDLLP